MADVVLGIDFGTSCTSAGALFGDRVELVRDRGDAVIPTVIYVPERGALEVGHRALAQQLANPQSVVRSVKRVLGLRADDDLVRRYRAGVACRIDATSDHRLVFKLGGSDYAPEQLAAAVLVRVRELAEQRFGGHIAKAVVTMSAAAPDGYRDAIVRAARIAHLDVVAMLPEPIAGALAVGMHGQAAERRFVVLDFGGGTFDACAIVQHGMQFTPVASCGDSLLGGDDFDEALAEGVAGHVLRQLHEDLHRDTTVWRELVFRCEAVKRALSSRREMRFVMTDAYTRRGRHDLELTIERQWAEQFWEPLVARARVVVVELLRRAGWTPEGIERVALIGGTSFVPLFQRMVGELFGAARVTVSEDADLAVAKGATLLTARYAATPRAVPMLTSDLAAAP